MVTSFAIFSSKRFLCSDLTLRLYTRFVVIFENGARECSLLSVLLVAAQVSQHNLKRPSFHHCVSCLLFHRLIGNVCDFIAGVFILFHWSMGLFLCHYHAVFMPVVWQYTLKSRRIILSGWSFFRECFKNCRCFVIIVLGISFYEFLGCKRIIIFCPMNFKTTCYISVENFLRYINRVCIESIYCFGMYGQFNITDSFHPRT